MISRRATTLIVVGVSLVAVLALAMTSLFAAAPTDTWYQCVNASGAIEANRGGVVVPTCANASDRKITWPVSLYAPAATTSTTAVVTTTVQTPATAAATTTAKAPVTTTTGATTTSQAPVTTTTTTTGASASTGIWHPSSTSSLSFDWVISATPSTSENVQVIAIDGFDNTAATVAAFHAHGTKVICYMDLGSYETYRADLNLFPVADIGNDVAGWAGEKWLNIADLNGLKPVIAERLQVCKDKGFDAVYPDETEGYTYNTGFPLTAADQLTYNTYIANTAHALGLSVGMKNDVDQTAALEPFFDWNINEECNQYSECDKLAPFTAANKAIFNIEFLGNTATICAADAAKHINGGAFSLDLAGSGHTACPAW